MTVRNARGKLVAHVTLKQAQHFHFRLTAGRYKLSGGLACTTKQVEVRAGKTTLANISCNIR